ncbi:MAG: copper amine oxidase protein [uncultured bacterium]|nr:MAG: copper amine oxidase protein [uncultured bacterium]
MKPDKHIPIILILVVVTLAGYFLANTKISSLQETVNSLTSIKDKNLVELERIGSELEELKNQDQIKINKDLKSEITNIQQVYTKAVSVYEELLDLKTQTAKTADLDNIFADSLVLLSKRDYTEAEKSLADLSKKILDEKTKIAASFVVPVNIPQNNTPPGVGYSRQQVTTDAGTFMVSLVAADIGSTKVIVDTASDSDCSNNCPVLSLATYVSRSSAFAGINGTYFCPASYPSCNGKTNTFDLLVMNKNKYYFNSANNVYSTNPAVIFGSGYIRFVSAASQWGRDTGVDGVLSNYPLLVNGGNISFGGDDDPKKGSKGARSFVANKGNTVYIGVVSNATVAESARVMKALGMENALNLDNGGSTALWSGGYKVGPGRDLPNAILFVKR